MANSNSTPEEQHQVCANEEEEDQFNRIPDELLILILTKIHQPDFKFLCRISLVSKRFSQSILLMPIVSISISSPIPVPVSSKPPDSDSDSPQDVADRFIDRKLQYLTSLRPKIDIAVAFLKKFHKIRSLKVVFVEDENGFGFSPSLVHWKTKFGFNLQSFVFLFAQSVSEKSSEALVREVTSDQLELRLYSSFDGVVDSIEWGSVLMSLLVQHPSLSSITVSGSRKGGEMCLRGEEISELRSSLSPEDILGIGKNGGGALGVTINAKSGFVPFLNLPVSGCVMKAVSLIVVRVGRRLCECVEDDDSNDFEDEFDDDDDEDDTEYDDNDIVNWSFDDDEMIFREAVVSFLTNHKDMMRRET